MESVGKKLREARTFQGRTLEQINQQTRISLRQLQAIEEDDCSHFSSPFFYRSFVKQYALAIGVDPSELELDVRALAASIPQPLVPGEGSVPPPRVKPLISRGHARLRWLYYMGSFALVLTACSGFYAAWHKGDGRSGGKFGALTEPLRSRLSSQPDSEQPDSTGEAGAPTAGADNSGAASEKRSGPGPKLSRIENGFRIELSALESTWVSIIADGKLAFTGILQPNEIKVLEERDSARIRMGNAGGLSCVFNGRPIGTFGPRGQVRTVVFKRSSYEVLQPPFRIATTLQISESNGE